MAYINKESSEYKLFEEENQKNKSLLSCIRKYTTKNNLNFNNYWENIIYPLDEKREEISLFDYIIENINDIKNIDKFLLDLIKDITVKNTNPITKFKMVSSNGIQDIKDSINKALYDTNMYNILDITLETPPIYTISSKDYDITTEDHSRFLETLISNNKTLFISTKV
jgi:translation initiation factor 2 alpha subunit (eIF-2alpha)